MNPIVKENMTKYHNKKCEWNDINFDSKLECVFYRDYLLPLLKAHEIKKLELQIPFDLHIGKTKIAQYRADFLVTENDGKKIVYEVKGIFSPGAKQKLRHFEEEYEIPVMIVTGLDSIERLTKYGKRK